jgi:hypothetical protein
VLARTGERFGQLPSRLVGIKDPAIALDFDIAATVRLAEADTDATKGTTRTESKDFRLPDGRMLSELSSDEVKNFDLSSLSKTMGHATVKDGRLVDYFDEHGIQVERIGWRG